MAIDSREKRASSLLRMDIPPLPDNSISKVDRPQVVGVYMGIGISGVIAVEGDESFRENIFDAPFRRGRYFTDVTNRM